MIIPRRQFLRTIPLLAAATVIPSGCQARRPAPTVKPAAATAGSGPNPFAPPKVGGSTRMGDAGAVVPAVVKTADPKSCRILQITDLHFFHETAEKDQATLADCRRQIERHHPDLVVISGDLWHDNPQGHGQSYLEFAIREFEGWGVPWTTCWGNHDLVDDYQRAHDALRQARGSCYRGEATHGDYRLEVRAGTDDATAAPRLDLFFLNSHADGLGPWQAQSLKSMLTATARMDGRPVPALAFFHIAICEYETRLTGTNFTGVKMEGAAHGREAGEIYPVLAGSGRIKACFCGHSHTNDYVVKTGPVDLHFGRSTGYAGYGGDRVRKGAKLIVVDLAKGSYEQRSVFADGSSVVESTRANSVPHVC